MKSDVEGADLTVLIAVDEASGHISTVPITDKSKTSLLEALVNIKTSYMDGRTVIKEFRSDNEPCFLSLDSVSRNIIGAKLSHVEEYRHTARAERSIRKIVDPFTATIHGPIPIPTFLYPQLLQYVTDSVNNVFNINNKSRTPHEQINKNDIVDYSRRASTHFGQLVRVHNPKPTSNSYYSSAGNTATSHIEASSCSYGIVIGHDPKRKHCVLIYNFIDGGTLSRAAFTPMDWSEALSNLYQDRIKHSISQHRPTFLDNNLTTITDSYPESLNLNTLPLNSTSDDNNMDVSEQLEDDSDQEEYDSDYELSEHETIWDELLGPPSNTMTTPFDNDFPLNIEVDTAILSDPHDDHSPPDPTKPTTLDNSPLNTDSIASRVRNRADRNARILMSINKALKKGYESTKIDCAVANEFGQMYGPKSKDVWDFLTSQQVRDLRSSGHILNVIPSSLFLKYKEQSDILKARLIVHGDKQIIDDIYENNSSPTISVNILFLVLSICSKMNLDFETIDIAGAYLNAELPTPEYMLIPRDLAAILVRNDSELNKYLSIQGTLTVRLKKALYGLKTSGKLWYETICPVLLSLGYTRSNTDKCLFFKSTGNKITYLLLYVDDILIAGNDVDVRKHTIDHIESTFEKISRQPINDVVFLGMHIKKLAHDDIQVDQYSYIDEILSDHDITTSSITPASTSINNDHRSDSSPSDDPSGYRSLNMQLMYAATRTRPDILFATSTLATRSHNPTDIDHERLTKILQYMHGTRHHLLTFSSAGPLNPHAYVDASFNLHWDAKGHTGFAIKPCPNSAAILIKCVKQKSVADSSTEAELLALHEAIKHISWIADVYAELGFNVTPINVYQDNKSAITICSREVINYKGRSKFFNRKLFGIHEYIDNNTVELVYMGTEDMVADMLTKAMASNKFRKFTLSLMGIDKISHNDMF